MAIVSVTSKGQATLPKEMRQRAGIRAPGRVAVVEEDGVLIVTPILTVAEFRRRYGRALAGETLRSLRREMNAAEAPRARRLSRRAQARQARRR